MDAWEAIDKAARDKRSGSVAVAVRAAKGVRQLTSRRDLMRAARKLLRAHPAMASLWRLFAASLAADQVSLAVDAYIARLETGSAAAADLRWVLGRRPIAVMTHSASGTVHDALVAARDRTHSVICTTSLPGGEGKAFAKRLETAGLATQVIADAAIARTCSRVDLVIVGADAVSDVAVVNKVGTKLLALAARDAGIPCYALAPTAKLVPHHLIDREVDAYEATPLELFDAILTERGPKRGAAVRRLAQRVEVPPALEGMKL